jgi:hypothetical protein
MASANPALVVRVAGTIEDLKQSLADGKAEVRAATAAIEQMGSQGTAGLQQLGAATAGQTEAAGRMLTVQENLRTSLGRFDGILASTGSNISGQIRALDEMAATAGKTAGQLGALSSAGLVVGTAIAGWEVGRAIANVLGLDAAIGHLTGSYQELRNQVVAAQQDTINKAIAEGATNVKTYADAVAYLNEKQKAQQQAQKDFEQGVKAITTAGQDWNKVLQSIDGTVVEAIKFYLDAGVSQKDLAAAYGLTAQQVEAVAEARKLDIAAMKLQQAMDEETFRLAQEHQKQWRDEIEATKNARNKATVEMLEKVKTAEAELGDVIAKQALSSSEYAIKQIHDRLDAELAAIDTSTEINRRYAAARIALADEMTQAIIQKERDAANAAIQAEIDAINALNAIIPSIGHGPTTPNNEGPAPIVVPPIVVGSVFHNRATGGPVDAGRPYVVGERGPEMFLPRTAGTIVPNGAAGVTNYFTVNVTQPLGTPQQIAAAIDEATMGRQRAIGTRF